MEITLRGPLATKDEAIGLLIKAGSGAVVEGEFFNGNRPTSGALHGKRAESGMLKASVPAGQCRGGAGKGNTEGAVLDALREDALAIGWEMDLNLTKDRDWSQCWRGGIRPVRLSYRGCGLLIHTSWSRAQKKQGETELVIDPSMAFGTGTHPTTRMCLKALLMLLGNNNNMVRQESVLDVGTGSAILLIAALKLGASRALGLEIDPMALKVGRDNLKINHVRARLSGSPLSSVTQKFTIITANIFSEELRRLAPELVGRLDSAADKKGGFIVLSGLLREQVPAVLTAYKGLGMRVYKKLVDREWSCLILQRKNAAGEGKGGRGE